MTEFQRFVVRITDIEPNWFVIADGDCRIIANCLVDYECTFEDIAFLHLTEYTYDLEEDFACFINLKNSHKYIIWFFLFLTVRSE